MFKCEDCNSTFEEPATIEEHHQYGMSYAIEYIAVCPNSRCHSTNFEEKESEEEC